MLLTQLPGGFFQPLKARHTKGKTSQVGKPLQQLIPISLHQRGTDTAQGEEFRLFLQEEVDEGSKEFKAQ